MTGWDDWVQAVQTVRPSGIYWTRKLAQDRRPLQLVSTMVDWDYALGFWYAVEVELKLVELFGHCGSKQGYRKILSRKGTPDGEDKGNWVYSVCLRTMLTLCPPQDWRFVGTQQLGDVMAGDIPEAIWGLLYCRHYEPGSFLARAVPEEDLPTDALRKYCAAMNRVVLMFVDFYPMYLRPGEWPTSQSLASSLI